jgi:hypothetical protein
MPDTKGVPIDQLQNRRELLQSVAVKAAVAALFGTVTLDALAETAMGRANETSSLRAQGRSIADDLKERGAIEPDDYDCTTNWSCSPATHPICTSAFSCTGYNCAGGGQTFDCQANYGTFNCSVFTCNSLVSCYGQGGISEKFTCPQNYAWPGDP